MKVLDVNNGRSNFIIEGRYVIPEELTRENLLDILNKIYEAETDSVEIPDQVILESIKNPIEREIVQQIIKKIDEFRLNAPNIRNEVQSQFPPIR